MSRILVLDDEPLIAMMVEDWLTELGHETIGPANSIKSALSLLEETTPDGAILDVSIAGEHCYSVADVLSERQVPFAFATGRSAEAIDNRFKQAPTLTKPFDFAALRDVMIQILRN